ncbi:MAG: hypothetical protein IKW98_01035 [Prevotella sp.]|nr:hypothetical protein [Prevotella sp.]
MKRMLLLCLTVVLSVNIALAQEKETTKFAGKIGPYAITLFLYPPVWNEGEVAGYYYYDERPKTHFTLKLVKHEAVNTKGSMHMVMKEYTPKGNHTGTFDGQRELRGDSFKGTFTNSRGKKYKFELVEVIE